ncbi:hypothetical protein [Ruania zhangjianzhongii]|uniref:hypothetical protein n=1 Tax=Ruania zhangjianzhongii TaxID=2603206 RepID=UPI0011C85776|nr:hypothetical protein [Ruania zhangjianzhongii]
MTHPHRDDRLVRRRGFLRGVGIVGAATVGMTLLDRRPPLARATAPDDLISRAHFDRLDTALNGGDGYKHETNDKDSSGLSGKLAWGEAYVLQGYALMYQSTHDTHYLDKMIDHIDHVLASRDSERGVTDFAGVSHPAWRADHHQTVGYATIPDRTGQPVFEVRSALAYADWTTVTVTSGAAGEFGLSAHNTHYDRTTTHEGLSADPADPHYAVQRVLEGFKTEAPQRMLITLRDLRADPAATDIAPGEYQMHSPPYIFEAHTGQIVQPMVLFAQLVRGDSGLRSNPTYAQRAETYLAAAADAIAVHDPEWRETTEGSGYYVTLPDAPVWHAGMDNPLNHFLALGRAIAAMATVTGDRQYIDRATALGWTLRDSMVPDGSAYVWPYWRPQGDAYNGWDIDSPRSQYRPWYPPNQVLEDTSHAQIDVNFALEYYRGLRSFRPGRRPPFGTAELRGLAATYTENVATTEDDGSPSVFRFVDGDGATGMPAYERQSLAWASLTPWNQGVLGHTRALLDSGVLDELPSSLYCLAHVVYASANPRNPR